MKIKLFNYDYIQQSSKGNIEIGRIPKDRGLESYRWTGSKLVYLPDLNYIWVKSVYNGFELHCIKVPYSQLVTMRFKDRKKLWNDEGVFRIKSDEMIQNELNFQYRRSHYKPIGDQLDILLKYLEKKTDLTDELQSLISDWRGVKEKYPKAVEK